MMYYVGIALLTGGVGTFIASMFVITGEWRRK